MKHWCSAMIGAGFFIMIVLGPSVSIAQPIVGSWQVGESAGLQTYTFRSDGTYTYIGALHVSRDVQATKEEDGIYQTSGDRLVISRQRGTFSTRSKNSALEPEMRVYRWRVGNTQMGLALQLIWPSGEAETFYKR